MGTEFPQKRSSHKLVPLVFAIDAISKADNKKADSKTAFATFLSVALRRSIAHVILLAQAIATTTAKMCNTYSLILPELRSDLK